MCLTRVNRWSDTIAIIVMFHEASDKKKIRTTSYLISWTLAAHQRNTEKTGPGLSASGGLIQKIYEVDPLTCPKCHGKMKILSFIEDEEIIKKILKHLGFWDVKQRPPPKAHAPPPTVHIDYSDSQVPLCEDYLYTDPDYPIEDYAS